MRADIFLYTHGYAKGRSGATALIMSGVVINGIKIKKPAQNVAECDEYDVIIENPQRYVSRGGLKLEAALKEFNISPKWLHCIDLGASTGGFTDCLLQNGAELVYAVDVGHGQLDPSLLSDKRVISMEGMNARDLKMNDIGERCPLVVSDLSFISQSLVYGTVNDILCDDGHFISLIKPQFEAGPENIGRGGLVKDKKIHIKVIERLFSLARAAGLAPCDLVPSPIHGGDGNVEYLALFKKGDAEFFPDIAGVVNTAMTKAK